MLYKYYYMPSYFTLQTLAILIRRCCFAFRCSVYVDQQQVPLGIRVTILSVNVRSSMTATREHINQQHSHKDIYFI